MKKLSNEKLLRMYRLMVLTRRFDEVTCAMAAEGKVSGWYHSRIGQEAVGVGVCINLTDDDYLVPYWPARAYHFTKGLTLRSFMAEILGKTTGCNRGLSGELHVGDASLRIIGESGIVAGQIPTAVGLAYACKLRGKGEVVVCNFGDGAVARGSFHESLNMASIWQLAVLFVCDNNLYGEFTPQNKEMRIKDISERAKAYAIPGVTVDGNDVLAVYEAAHKAVTRARAGEGPTLIEAKTYRWHGHFEGDSGNYRPQAEVDEWKRKDPIPRFREKLFQMNVLTEEKVAEISKGVEQEIEDAVKFAMESPAVSREDMLSAPAYTSG